MRRWFSFGLTAGSSTGLIAVLIIFWLVQTPRPAAPQASAPEADISLFLSERALSRAAETALDRPAVVDCEPGGQMRVTTRAALGGGFEPAVQLVLLLEQQGNQAVSRVQGLQLAYLRVPGRWLPAELTRLGAIPGQTMSQQIPPGFTLVGLTTDDQGITFYLDWVGPL